jgi:hypothetical protein
MPSNTSADSLAAIQDITDAIRATTAFLWPPDLRQYLKLGFLIVFLGGVGGIGPVQLLTGLGNVDTDTPGTDEAGPNIADGLSTSFDTVGLALIIGIVVAITAILIGLLLIGSVFEFIFVEVLREEQITIRAYWRQWWRQGLRLFGFRLLVGVFTLVPVAVIAFRLVTPFMTSGPSSSASFGRVVIAIAISATIITLGSLLTGLTKMFVVPVMIAQDETLFAAWQRFWPTVRGEWKEYIVYLVLRFILQLIIGTATGAVLILAGIIFAIPAILILAAGILLSETAGIISLILIIVALLVFVLGILASAVLTAIPIQTFLRYYALLLLGDTNDRFDLIADRRVSLRKS